MIDNKSKAAVGLFLQPLCYVSMFLSKTESIFYFAMTSFFIVTPFSVMMRMI